MGEPLEALKAELERFGEANDAAISERPRRMLNITRDTGEFLGVMVRAVAARRVLEIGTSNGYSTLWLAEAARGGWRLGFLSLCDQSAYDLVFLDSERPEYPGRWPQLRRALRPGGLLIVGNATFHVEQMAPFVALATADPEFVTCLVPVGNGECLAVKMSS